MDKVKVSKELAMAIESVMELFDGDKSEILKGHGRGKWAIKRNLPLNELTHIELAEILINGYEIERQWYETRSPLQLVGDVDTITLMSNQNDWTDKNDEFPLYIKMEGDTQKTFTGLSLKQMKQMKDYLEEKINYLEN